MESGTSLRTSVRSERCGLRTSEATTDDCCWHKREMGLLEFILGWSVSCEPLAVALYPFCMRAFLGLPKHKALESTLQI